MDDPQMINRSFEQINTYLLSHLNVEYFQRKNVAIVNEKLVGIAQSTLGTVSILGNLAVMYLCSILCSPVSTWVIVWPQYMIKHSNEHCPIKEIHRGNCNAVVYAHRGSRCRVWPVCSGSILFLARHCVSDRCSHWHLRHYIRWWVSLLIWPSGHLRNVTRQDLAGLALWSGA